MSVMRPASASREETLVRTSSGLLRGEAVADAVVFRGVPYAAPPTGALRFRPPTRPERWAGVRDALTPAPPLPQPPRALPGLDSSLVLGPGWHQTAPELTLNVWTPDPTRGAQRPVLAFVHCGGFVAGSPNTPLYDGRAFARDGVVCVTVTYRLGAEGFLAFEDGTANLGLHDLAAALSWVQEEIDAFGGDPSQVTVAGQSAGAMCVALLLGGPAGRGLARRAISQSGGLDLTFDPPQALKLTHALAGTLGVAPTREGFARVTLPRLTAAVGDMTLADVDVGPGRHPGGGIAMFLPVRDGVTVAENPLDDMASAGLESLLAGSNAEEGNLYLAGLPEPPAPAAAWNEATTVVGRFHGDPRQALDQAGADRPGATPRELAADLLTDAVFRMPTRRLIKAHAAGSGQTYAYEFTWRSPAAGGRLGACHCVELPAIFETQREPSLLSDHGLLGESGYPPRLAAYMHDKWVRFAKNGDPGWPSVREDTHPYQRIDETPSLVTAGNAVGRERRAAVESTGSLLQSCETRRSAWC